VDVSTVLFLRELSTGELTPMAGGTPLVNLRQGDRAIIASLPDAARHLHKLLVFGVLPGTEIEVLQVFPGYVVVVGNTMLAMDREIAGSIMVIKK
jgi:ferrous iron transport protein A